jgi:uncharacterized cofD-like protein
MSAGARREVVAVGGGHGLAATLRALRLLPVHPTAVVSVADDGGSSGRLRAESERVAPGDLRKCLTALASGPEQLVGLMEHRFEAGELKGHSFGNLLLAALEESGGDLLHALDVASSLLGCDGRVLPATTDVVELVAELEDGSEMVGQSEISATSGIRAVRLHPRPQGCEPATRAIESAEMVVLGPGSLYTSVLAAAVVPEISAAIERTSATVVYVCNLWPQAHETDGYDAADHVAALERHGLHPEVVLVDPACIGSPGGVPGVREVSLAGPNGRVHSPDLLAAALAAVLDRSGPVGHRIPGNDDAA